ncbi:FkbM family methyltransferase [Pseudomonadota bacterium]
MPSTNASSITIVNNIHVTVPSSPQFMTTFVLLEQNDWFEDEMVFVRHFIKPGMKVVDIGANYGLYTLSIANIIGDSGKIWAFEPTESTSAFLKESISRNKFKNIRLIQSGLSNRLGKAELFTSPNSELNSLSMDASPSNQHETISLLTLDYCMQKYGWECIDFIKLDAEGEESNILEKGEKTLSFLSPLIMFELKHGESVNLPLISRFINMGYDSYRLIPGLNMLVPFNHNEPFDEYLLNLLCCKEGKAKLLEEEGIIVRNWEEKNTVVNTVASEYVESLPYGRGVLANIINNHKVDDVDSYLSILNAYIMSLSQAESSSNRVGFLMDALSGLRSMIAKGEQRIERLVTFARIAFDAGERVLGMQILSGLINRYSENINYELSEIFLPASQRYDNIVPDKGINEWLFSSILEQWIVKHAFSSYFTRDAALPLLKQLHNLGYMDENMERRHKLINSCFSK